MSVGAAVPSRGYGESDRASAGGLDAAAGVVLGELAALRATARGDRHAYWLPLVLFGVMVCAASPMYVSARETPLSDMVGQGWFSALGGMDALGDARPNTRAVYWLVALLVGAGVIAAWYPWHAAMTGVATRTRGSVMVWAGGAFALLAVSVLSLTFLSNLIWLTSHGTGALIVIGVGLGVLSWVERSVFLAVTTALFMALTAPFTFFNDRDIIATVRGLGGPPNYDRVWDNVGIAMWLPGSVLLLAGLVALVRAVRRR